MPLVVSTLNSGLLSLFSEPPEGFDACAQTWSDAILSYGAAVVPVSTTVSAAALTLVASLSAAFAVGTPATAAQMELAFTAFALTVGAGMLPTFIATPPPAPVGWATAFAETPPPETHADAADKYSNLIDTWMKTGTAVPSVGGATINWS